MKGRADAEDAVRSQVVPPNCRLPRPALRGASSMKKRTPCRNRARLHPCRRDRLVTEIGRSRTPGKFPTPEHCSPRHARPPRHSGVPVDPISRGYGAHVREDRSSRWPSVRIHMPPLEGEGLTLSKQLITKHQFAVLSASARQFSGRPSGVKASARTLCQNRWYRRTQLSQRGRLGCPAEAVSPDRHRSGLPCHQNCR